jgi:membrane protease YdiL (CAAX protease family)
MFNSLVSENAFMDLTPLSWFSKYEVPVIVLATATVAYLFSYFAPLTFPWLLRHFGATQRTEAIWSVLLARVFGFIVLGPVTAIVAIVFLPPMPNRYGINFQHFSISIVPTIAVCLLVGGILYLGYKIWPPSLKGYPEINVHCWDTRLLTLNTLSWIIYLSGYEFFFRGFLLYPLAEHFGSWPAILVTTALYSYTHLVKQPQEAASAAMLGIFYGAVALLTGSILCPLLVHIFIAPTSEYLAILANPNMKIVRQCPH